MVCGSLLANDTTGQRLEAHLVGKQHTGFDAFVFLILKPK